MSRDRDDTSQPFNDERRANKSYLPTEEEGLQRILTPHYSRDSKNPLPNNSRRPHYVANYKCIEITQLLNITSHSWWWWWWWSGFPDCTDSRGPTEDVSRQGWPNNNRMSWKSRNRCPVTEMNPRLFLRALRIPRLPLRNRRAELVQQNANNNICSSNSIRKKGVCTLTRKMWT